MIEKWRERKHGKLTHESTQMLTGHGVFKQYLYKMAKIDSPKCNYCKEEIQDNTHILTTCPQWREERETLREKIGMTLNVGNIIRKIIENKEKWDAFETFCQKTIGEMTKDENHDQNKNKAQAQDRIRIKR